MMEWVQLDQPMVGMPVVFIAMVVVMLITIAREVLDLGMVEMAEILDLVGMVDLAAAAADTVALAVAVDILVVAVEHGVTAVPVVAVDPIMMD